MHEDQVRNRRIELEELAKVRRVSGPEGLEMADDEGLRVAYLATALGFDPRHAFDVSLELAEVERRAIRARATVELQQARAGADRASLQRRVESE